MALSAKIQGIYENCAEQFDQVRSQSNGLMEKPYLDEVLGLVDSNAIVLDLGCGAGEPMARYLIDAGCSLTGVDSSESMIAIAKNRFANAEWLVGDMRKIVLGTRFDVIIAWDSFFHLSMDDQRSMFKVFESHIRENGILIFTCGPQNGEAIGDMFGSPLFHASLDLSEYEELLKSAGFKLIRFKSEDPKCGMHSVLIARYVG